MERRSLLVGVTLISVLLATACGGDAAPGTAGGPPERPVGDDAGAGAGTDAGAGADGGAGAGSGAVADAGAGAHADAGSGADAGADAGAVADAGGGGPIDPSTDAGAPSSGPCTSGAYRCNGNVVEICNSSGSAWLFSATCAYSCAQGLCTGACSAGERRCHGNVVEECNTNGTQWNLAETCSVFCDRARCAVQTLDIGQNTNLDGEQIVADAVIVRAPATLTSSSGNLTIRAKSITVENGAFIVIAPTGDEPSGRGQNGSWGSGYYWGAGGGKNASYGSTTDATVVAGGRGGDGASSVTQGGMGGGLLRLVAERITIAGQLTANGVKGPDGSSAGAGGGSGGGILIAGDDVSISGTVSAQGGAAGSSTYSSYYNGGAGDPGRIKVLHGATKNITGTLSGTVTQGILPPLEITSSTHPSQTMVYNDDFANVSISWSRPFPSRQGYYRLFNQLWGTVPSPANSLFMTDEHITIPRASLQAGVNYFHLTSVDSRSVVSTVESYFYIQVNTTTPTVTSSSHPMQGVLSSNPNVFYAWTFPLSDALVKGAYYILDAYPTTVPTKAATFLPITQKQLLLSGLNPGVWFFHLVAEDTHGYLTKAAAHYRVDIGGAAGSLSGKVINNTSQNIEGATVTLSRGVYVATTNSAGDYTFPSITPGSYELEVRKSGYPTATRRVTVTAGGATTENFTLIP
ncbi:MAG: carboxypeptidase regulatory-like domain-containing protein [Deltaproteobacteria bacterium]|nr:carboxypeptidase regulatory-like domain-containing protein [Deltaproteobacteria bacterium]